MKRIVLIIMAALLLACLAPMPYGYYHLVRFAAMVAFAYLAYDYYKLNKVGFSYAFVALAVLFQPLLKIALGRAMWNIADVVVAAFLIVLFISERNTEKQ